LPTKYLGNGGVEDGSKFLEYLANRFKQLVRAYVWFNPHLSVRGVWFGHEFINVKATNPNWKNGGRATDQRPLV
jgi:hypothetical protein